VIAKAVKVTGAHIADHGEVNEKWIEVNTIVFNSDEFRIYKTDHYKATDASKIRSKFDSMSKKIMSTMGWSDFFGGTCQNLSGYSGDLNEVARLIKEIQQDIENKSASDQLVADAAQHQKEKLEKISKDAFNTKPSKKGAIKQKTMDGTIIDRSAQPPRKSDTELLLEAFGFGKTGSNNKRELEEEEEEVVEALMNTYVLENAIDHNSMGVAAEMALCLSDLGMSTLIGIYCEKKQGFDPGNFKSQLKELVGFIPGSTKPQVLMDVHKVYTFLNTIRLKECSRDSHAKKSKKEHEFVTPSLSSASSASTSSSSSTSLFRINDLANTNFLNSDDFDEGI
jgi:hypothetical protein